MLKELTQHFGKNVFYGEDLMDDGTLIKLRVTLDTDKQDYVFDFEGTSPQVYGNLKAPRQLHELTILYCLRSWLVRISH
ncbi:ANM_HP_G0096070.mRNA.1.CDS.1 [Saccharomyces cerevisiae]|nr:ANM_HP_G0096070.mRNA.1.CDS.1 [Saccharomyces cerevisiae]CAI6382320.1 ANM_HP_G0096070.mRNA.1.CDS.1 [Saccharomyces cerevisiae]